MPGWRYEVRASVTRFAPYVLRRETCCARRAQVGDEDPAERAAALAAELAERKKAREADDMEVTPPVTSPVTPWRYATP
eukprot:4200338-Pyramimonas_sp.AAC.1